MPLRTREKRLRFASLRKLKANQKLKSYVESHENDMEKDLRRLNLSALTFTLNLC